MHLHYSANVTLPDYENAGIYASYLLETYSDYKAIWKRLQVLTEEFQSPSSNFELAQAHLNDEMMKRMEEIHSRATEAAEDNYAIEKAMALQTLVASATMELNAPERDPEQTLNLKAVKEILDEAMQIDERKPFQPAMSPYDPYPATVLGLLDARQDCRMEMVKIVNERFHSLLRRRPP